ncbi:MAG: phage portal protein [Phycisphaerae bacterium]
MADVSLSLGTFGDAALSGEDVLARLAWLREVVRPRLERFLGYYRNPTSELAAALPGAGGAGGASFAVRPFRQFQELGLPARITGFRRSAEGTAVPTGAIDVHRKEVVIENDIGWRVNTLVDFAAGRMPAVTSTARDAQVRERLTRVIGKILEAAGGVQLLQELVLQGAICGSAWVHFRPTGELLRRLAMRAAAGIELQNGLDAASAGEELLAEEGGEGDGGGQVEESVDPDSASIGSAAAAGEESLDVARWLHFEVIDAGRLCPLPFVGDSACAERGPAYAALLRHVAGDCGAPQTGVRFIDRLWAWLGRPMALTVNPREFSFDLFGAGHWQRYERGELLEEGPNLLGVVPFVRYENQSDPSAGTRVGALGSAAIDTGFSDVEPLIGLQDELNTRLSDRAFRVTMTSFQMYLGKGIDEFTKRPVGPGQMWSTDNPEATVQAFGGDASTPSEDSHINEVREALDKISGVTPIAAGVIRDKLGHLTSAIALRMTLIALLARTERKRAALTRTLSTLVQEVLMILDNAGLVASAPEDRGIDVNWPSALPESDMDHLQEAQVKLALGVPQAVVLSDLGYAEVAGGGEFSKTTALAGS